MLVDQLIPGPAPIEWEWRHLSVPAALTLTAKLLWTWQISLPWRRQRKAQRALPEVDLEAVPWLNRQGQQCTKVAGVTKRKGRSLTHHARAKAQGTAGQR